jgi:hypothetical protein
MARAAVAAGADGILIEVHPVPEKAWSDGAQAAVARHGGRDRSGHVNTSGAVHTGRPAWRQGVGARSSAAMSAACRRRVRASCTTGSRLTMRRVSSARPSA